MVKSKLFILTIVVLAAALVFSSCSQGETSTTGTTGTTSGDGTTADGTTTTPAETTSGIDLSEEVNLVFYMAGDPNPDEENFIANLNELSLRDFNATIEFNYLNWSEIWDKYPLIMASGEEFDGTYAARWLDFYINTQKGAFLDITDMIPEYCPEVLALADEDTWKAVTYKGRIYGIPRSGKDDFNADGIVYREDLRKKYDVPEIESIEDFEAYFVAIKENEPDIKPVSKEAIGLFVSGLYEKAGFADPGLLHGISYNSNDPDPELFLPCDQPEYKEMIELMAKWQGMGMWTTAEMTRTDWTNVVAETEFGQGTCAIWSVTSGHWYMAIEYFEINDIDYETGFYYPLSPDGNTEKWDSLEDGAAVSITSKNPERTLMAINKFLTDVDYHMALSFGEKDLHYVIDSDGMPDYPEGVSADNSGIIFGMNSFSWFWYGEELFPETRNQASDILDLQQELAVAPTLLGFYFDAADVQVEVGNMNDVLMQYEVPLKWGFINDSVEEDIATLRAQLDAAGYEKVREEMQKQADAFLESND